MRYWIYVNGRTEGSFSSEQLRRLAVFTADTLVCPDGARGGEDWRPARDRPELAELVSALPKRWWVLDDDRKPQGPLDIERLRKLQGLSPATKVCPGGSKSADDWRSAGDVPELRPLFEPVEPSAPAVRGPVLPPPKVELPSSEPMRPRVRDLPAFKTQADRLDKRLPLAALALLVAGAGAWAGRGRVAALLRRRPAPPAPLQATTPREDLGKEALSFVKDWPLPGPAARPLPANLNQIGETGSDRHWKPARRLIDLFRYRPYLAAAESAAALARARNVSDEEAGRLVRAKISELQGGLDEAYRIAWSTSAEGGSRYRVEARVADGLTPRLREAFPETASGAEPGGPIEVHAFLADLSARTVEPATPAAEEDLKPKGRSAPLQGKPARTPAPKPQQPSKAEESKPKGKSAVEMNVLELERHLDRK